MVFHFYIVLFFLLNGHQLNIVRRPKSLLIRTMLSVMYLEATLFLYRMSERIRECTKSFNILTD